MRGIRFRATALVAAVLAVALLAGGLLLTSVLRDRLISNLDTTIVAATEGRAALIADGADPATLTDTRLQEALVWIGRPDGRLVANGGRILSGEPPGGTAVGTRTVVAQFQEDHGGVIETEREELRVHAAAVTSPTLGGLVVIVGSEQEVVDGPVKDVATILFIGSPILLLVVAALTWVTADRALRPVEDIRAGAERISVHAPGATIDVPPTGDEIEDLAMTVNAMLERLAAQDARQREFVGDASHELKSPLANLRIDIETTPPADAGSPDGRARQLAQIDRLTAIVDDLLALARHDENHDVRREPVDLDDVVFDVLAAAGPGHDRLVHIDDVRPTRVRGDDAQLRRLVRNLIDNATRHAAREVAVSLTTSDGLAVLDVDDDGPGVAIEARDHVFERFARSDTGRARDDGGTGLGLAIVRQVAERHGGHVVIQTAPLGGARFRVSLPADEA